MSICKDFKITYFSEILSGQWDYLFTYVDLFNEKLEAYNNPEDNSNLINPDDILEEEEEEDHKEARILSE